MARLNASTRRTDGISFRNFDGAWYSSVTGPYAPLRTRRGKRSRARIMSTKPALPIPA